MGALESKKQKVEDVKGLLTDNLLTLVVDYRGLSVARVKELRRSLAKDAARLHVFKNTLIRRAIANTDLESMGPSLKGPTAVAFCKGDQVAPVKTLKEFFKKYKLENEIRGGFLDGKALNAQDVEVLSKLPSLDELRGKLVGALAAPQNGLVAALSSPQRGLVSVLDQLAKKKQEAGG